MAKQKKVTLLGQNFETVGELMEALSKLPPETPLNPFGSSNALLFYIKKDKRAYLDEDYDWIEDEDIYNELEDQIE